MRTGSLRNFLTYPFGVSPEMQHFGAKNAYGGNATASGSGARNPKNPGRKLRRPAMVMQNPCAKQGKCTTQRGANIGAPSTVALVLKEISR
jgi:hypothetical protein